MKLTNFVRTKAKKQAFLVAFVILALGMTGQARAANVYGDRDMSSPIDLASAYRLPGIFATSLSIVHEGNTITGSFTALNNEDSNTLSNLQYNIEVLGKAATQTQDADSILYDRRANRELFYLAPKETKNFSFTYNINNLPEGEYRLRIQIVTSQGKTLGWDDETFHIQEGSKTFVKFGSPGIFLPYIAGGLDPLSGPNVSPGQTFSFRLSAENTTHATLTVTPVIDTFVFDIARGTGEQTSHPKIILKPLEKKNITLEIKAKDRPEVYSTLLRLVDENGKTVSNMAEGRYVVTGKDADVFPIRFQKLGDMKGDEIVMQLDFAGSPDAQTKFNGNVAVEIRDDKGLVTSTSIENIPLSDRITQTTARLTLERDLESNPVVRTIITDDTGNVVDQQNIVFPSNSNNNSKAGMMSSKAFLVYLGVGLIAILLLLFIMIKKTNMLQKLYIMLVLFVMVGLGVLGISLTANAAGNGNGIEVWTPANANVIHDLTQFSGPIFEIFVNSPIHDAPAGTYQKNAVPLEYVVRYAICQNRITYLRVVGRYDVNGGKQTTLQGTNANWEVVHNKTYQDGPQCPGGLYVCFGSKEFTGTLDMSNLASGKTSTTLQMTAKWGQSGWTTEGLSPWDMPSDVISATDFSFDTTGWGVNFANAWSLAHTVNIWINFASSTPPACTINTDCGANGFTGGPFCQGNSVFRNFVIHACMNPGTASSYCSTITAPQLQQNCSASQTCSSGACVTTTTQCSDGVDNDGDGATDYPSDFSCSSSSDDDETNPKAQCQDGIDNDGDGLIDFGQDSGCASRQDNDEFNAVIACNANSQCGSNAFTGGNFCQGNSVYRNFTTYTCNNAGTASSFCSNSTTAQLQQICSNSSTCASGTCSPITTTCTSHASQRCSGNSLYWFDSCGNQQELYQICANGCANNACIVAPITQDLIAKQGRNLSAGTLAWSTSVGATPTDILQFQVVVTAPVNQSLTNIVVRDTFPANLAFYNNLTIDGVATSGNITQGINLGTVNAGQTKTITYQAQVAQAGNFAFGTTTLTNSATVSSSTGSFLSDTSSANVVVNRITGTVTQVPTGLTNNPWVDSFGLPLLAGIGAYWVWRKKLASTIGMPKWLRNK